MELVLSSIPNGLITFIDTGLTNIVCSMKKNKIKGALNGITSYRGKDFVLANYREVCKELIRVIHKVEEKSH